jgi:hypothetical protein
MRIRTRRLRALPDGIRSQLRKLKLRKLLLIPTAAEARAFIELS